MPFVPMTPEERERYQPPCTSREHAPPPLAMVVTHPMKWVCPSCGQATMVLPNTVTCEAPRAVTVTSRDTKVWDLGPQ